ncbi:MAG TPA: hypothetical protein PKA27_17540, partial [Fimbriimonadaceae bacterium]|nr:hypothetical protein [Fimbriimonadaceae bacterium]
TITIARDGNQRITSVTDAWGRVTSYLYQTFSSVTRLVEIREPAPTEKGWYSTFLGYDSSGRLIQITNAIGEATRFEYDGSSRISKAIDGHGHETIYTYDGSSRVTNIEDPDENDTVFAYATSPAITTTVTDRLTFNTVYTFDASGRIIKVKDAEDNETEFAYDSTTWNLTVLLGPKIPVSGTPWSRHREVFIYDTDPGTLHDLLRKELRKATNSDATGTLISDVEYTYNAQHDVLTETDQEGNVTTYTYKIVSSKSIGLVETVVNGKSETIQTNTYELDSGMYRLQKTANGVSKETEFDYGVNGSFLGIPDRITDPAGAITNLKIDIRSRVIVNTGPSGNATSFEYDALDRLIRTLNPDDTSTANVYDCCHLVATINENKVGMKFEYDLLGRKSSETDANGETTTFVYNAEGWMTSQTDPRGKATSFSHDDIGRTLQIDYPGGWQDIFTYFEPGMLKTHRSKKSSSEATISFVYNDSYFLTKVDMPAGTDTDFEVDLKGRITKMTDASGEKRYTWEDADHLEKVVQGPAGFVDGTNQNYKVEYTWNAASQVTEKKLTIRTQSAKEWDYAFTDAGYLDTVTNPDSEVTKFEYLTDGRLKKITLRSTAGSNKATREFFYQDT